MVQNHDKKKILLTGGNGFIGKNILLSYLASKYNIIAPRSFELNLIDSDSVSNFFQKNGYFDAVLHSAVKPGHRNAKDSSNLLYSNLRMFENLEFHKAFYSKFINFGSGAIYNTDYDISKAKEVNRFASIGNKEHDFCKYIISKQIKSLDNFIDLHIFGIFGKFEDWEIRFISNAVCKAVKGLPITLRQNREFSYLWIEDLYPILEFFIENKTKYKAYNIVPDESVFLLDIAHEIRELSENSIGITLSNDLTGLEYTGDNSRLREVYPEVSFTPIKEAVRFLYRYYREHKDSIDTTLLVADK